MVDSVHIRILLLVNMEQALSSKNYHHCESKTFIEVEFPLQLESSIRCLCERQGFIEYEIAKQKVSTVGGNYLSKLYEIDIEGTTNKGPTKLNLFVKCIIGDLQLKVISLSDIYATEMFAYKELFKILLQLQEQANVPLNERYKVVKLYEESNTKALIMENIAKTGFISYNRMEVAPLNFYEMSVKQLAKFHGLSFVLRETKPDYFRKIIQFLKFPFNFNDDWTKMVMGLRNASINYVDDGFKERLEKAYDALLYRYSQYYMDDKLRVCIRHGDYRPSNIMVKIDKGVIQDLMPIDYQLIHYGCPIFDFLHLIFAGTDRSFRKANLLNLKDLYYQTLSEFLKYFDLDANAVYPRVEFEKVYKEKLDFGLMHAMFTLPFGFAAENDLPDISLSDVRYNFDARIKERFHGVLEDFTEWGYL